jgi:hypothetical protein
MLTNQTHKCPNKAHQPAMHEGNKHEYQISMPLNLLEEKQ